MMLFGFQWSLVLDCSFTTFESRRNHHDDEKEEANYEDYEATNEVLVESRFKSTIFAR